ncbi:DedA family protein [Blastococcus brunescens]|uniref:VTT domain-containing protein n=1 Tax=Blastococcus brunescens TaxID=1564165 RepID=A0ABZ1B1M5_9ACTN|nr:VTT domain-containing protein [Blastococcus sp. BMG 8361]WRL64262.1 VTT domain-containing protein [Blastococcus sp. BMG 8361]
MNLDVLANAWDGTTSVGYPLLFGLVLLGSVVPVVPTGLVVGTAAAFAMTTDNLGLPLVLAVATLAALTGDLITFAIARFGGPSAVRWLIRGQHAERVDEVREQFRVHGWQIVVAGRLLPAGRIPVLVAAGALAYPWRRLVPASLLAAFLWALAYALLGVVSGGIFDSPLIAMLVATVLVLAVSAAMNVVSSRRRRVPAAPEPEPCESV